ncbi:MAG: LysR family transcriptional regulator [Gammaproteobacteria bacterium]
MLGNIELFCHTAELASFTKAAARAAVTQAAVSRAVSRLEAQFGVQLLVRSTRSVRLTERGRTFYEQCRQALHMLADAERELSGDQQETSGTVRLSLPTSYGHCRVLPILADFMQAHPRIKLDIQLSNRNADLIADGFDLAIRARVPADSGLIACKLEEAPLLMAASPAYLRRHGMPQSLDDLARHRCIGFERPRTGQLVPWLVLEEGAVREITPEPVLLISDDIQGVPRAAMHGLGICQTYRFMVEDQLRAGLLAEVLPAHGGATRPFSLLYPGQRHMPRRVRVLIDYLLARLRDQI